MFVTKLAGTSNVGVSLRYSPVSKGSLEPSDSRDTLKAVHHLGKFEN